MKRKTFPLRINEEILTAMQRWANDDLRSVNAQIEFVLRQSLTGAGRFKAAQSEPVVEGESSSTLVNKNKEN